MKLEYLTNALMAYAKWDQEIFETTHQVIFNDTRIVKICQNLS